MLLSIRQRWSRRQSGLWPEFAFWTGARAFFFWASSFIHCFAASGVRCVMFASGEVTQGVGRYVTSLSNVTPRYLGSEQKGRVSLLILTFSSRLATLLLRWKTAGTVFVVLSFSFHVWRYSHSVAMSLLSAPSTACQSPSVCMIARSSAYAYCVDMVVGRSEI